MGFEQPTEGERETQFRILLVHPMPRAIGRLEEPQPLVILSEKGSLMSNRSGIKHVTLRLRLDRT